MNQFPALIEYLLLNHNYVVIPGMGSFITQRSAALRNEAEEAFLPPLRLVRFNAELMHDDNLVASTIASIYKVDFHQASQMLGAWVDEFYQAMEDNGCLEFGAIGVFNMEEDGTMTFTSQESGVMTPDFYGLDAFHFCEVERVKKAKVVPIAASLETNERVITIRLNRRLANYVVAACAVLLMFVMFHAPTPGSDTGLRSSIKELLIPISPVGNVQQTGDMVLAGETPAATDEPSAPAPERAIPPTQEQESEEYCIVMASAISQVNAERYVSHLTNNGFLSARIVTKGSMTRVVVGHYQSEEEANADARDIRHRSNEYAGAWVMQL